MHDRHKPILTLDQEAENSADCKAGHKGNIFQCQWALPSHSINNAKAQIQNEDKIQQSIKETTADTLKYSNVQQFLSNNKNTYDAYINAAYREV